MKCPYVMRKCSKCGEILHMSKFYKNKKGKYGFERDCKECRKAKSKKYKEEHEDYNKKYYENNKDYYKERYENNREYYLELNKKWAKDNESYKEYKRNYAKEYRKNNPDKVFNQHKNRISKQENQGDGITKEQWLEMMNFFDWKCAYSGIVFSSSNNKRDRSLDHIVALDNGGEHEIWNLVPCYLNYNSSKREKNMLEWYLKQPFFSIERLTKIYEWRIYAYEKWGKEMV